MKLIFVPRIEKTHKPDSVSVESHSKNCESFFEILKEKLLKGEMSERDLPKRLDVDGDLALDTFEKASLGAKYNAEIQTSASC